MAAPTAARDRIEFIDGLRALAALFVVAHHAWLTIWPIGYHRYPAPGLPESLTTWLSFGHFAVAFFIVISGFCLGLPIARKGAAGWQGALNFYGRRARRILGPYYAAILFTVLLILTLIGTKTGTHWDTNIPIVWPKALWSLVMLNNVFGVNQINGVFWSIAVEWQIYMLFPALVFIWLRYGIWWSALLATVVGYAVAIMTNGTHWQGFTAQFLAFFALGYCTAYVATDPSWRQRLSKFPWAVFGVVVIAAEWFRLRHMNLWHAGPKFLWLDAPMGVAAACIVLGGCYGDKRLLNVLCMRPLLKIGTFSYSLYLIHMPILQVVWQYGIRPFGLSDNVQFVVLLVAGVPICVGTAWVFYRLVERHFDPAAMKREAGKVAPLVEVAASHAAP